MITSRMQSVLAVPAALLLTSCAMAHSSSGSDQPYIDRRINGDRVTYRHLKAQIIADAVTREAIKFCKERDREAFFVARHVYNPNQLLSSFDCRKPVPK